MYLANHFKQFLLFFFHSFNNSSMFGYLSDLHFPITNNVLMNNLAENNFCIVGGKFLISRNDVAESKGKSIH